MASIGYLVKTAYRDSRKDRSKLVLFMSSIVLGIAALVAINSFNDNLVKDIEEQSKSLLGADLVITSRNEMNEALIPSIDSLEAERSNSVGLISMSYLPKTDDSQLIRVNALEGGFPFYGNIKTEPAHAYQRFQEEQYILVDESMMIQYDLIVGDSIRIGEEYMLIGGKLQSTIGSNFGNMFAPKVFITSELLEKSKLIQPGSLTDYSYYFKLPDLFDADEWKESHKDQFRNESMRMETISDQKEDLDEAFSSLNYFLNMVALVSLLLGCIGVASSVMIYVKSKISSIAIFRCLGMHGRDAFMIYFIQIFALAILSVIVGVILGTGIQLFLPIVLQDFLPYKVDMSISWSAVWEGLLVGIVVTMLFALLPLVSVRNISPLRTLRSTVDDGENKRDLLKWVIYFAIFLSLFLFLWRLTDSPKEASFFLLGIIISFAILFGVSKLITWGVRRYFPHNWSFVFRQGLSNLYRPNNQTNTLIVSIGLGTAILSTLFIIQGLLLENVSSMDSGDMPNTIVFGIEKDQKEEIAEITKRYDLPVIRQDPTVVMRLSAWKGKSKEQWLADTSRTASRWAINREARASFRDSLNSDEKLVAGEYTGHVNAGDSIFISLADNFAEALDVELGDELIWNVQGVMITTYVGSLREIEFRSMNTRFFVLFPSGVLENAPQSQILVTKSPDVETTAKYRGEVVKTFPNISVIDLGMILLTINDILKKVSYIIQFMAGFSILTGLIVLISSLFLSKYQRIRESVLLRTLGAVKGQILKINFTEYLLLGSLSALTGIVIALIGSFILAKYQLELDFDIRWFPIFLIFIFIVGLTVIIGLINSRDVLIKSPLEVLRKEVG